MSSIKDCERLIAELYLANLTAKDGLNITGLLSGMHGTGKTQIIKSSARRLGGIAITADGSIIKEGEMTGLPIAHKTEDGNMEVRFVPHQTIAKIKRMEEAVFEKAKTTGFINGKYKLTDKGIEIKKENGKTEIVENMSETEKILLGEENRFKFGKNLTGEQKLELIESGEITPIILLIDELNRAENQTMKELMNIILEKNINGYELPWFVSIVSAINPCSQNSTYATNEMDPAQLDRFLKIKVDARLDDWIDYAMKEKLNIDVVTALAANDQIFIYKNDSLVDQDVSSPSPRSWEMVAHLFDSMELIKKSKFFTAEERSDSQLAKDLGVLVNGKVGPTAAPVLFEALKDKESQIKPEEILNGKAPEIDKKVAAKLKGLRQLRKKIIADSCVNYLVEHICEFEKKLTTEEGKKAHFNLMQQIKEFASDQDLLDQSTRILFIRNVARGANNRCPDGKTLYVKIAKCFSKEMMLELGEFKSDLESI